MEVTKLLSVGVLIVTLASVKAATNIFYPDLPAYFQEHTSFTLKCMYGGSAVIWYKNNVKIDTEQNTGFDVTSKKEVKDNMLISELTKSNAVEKDTGNYECRPEGGIEGSGYIAQVTIFKMIPTNATMVLGSDATLSCSVSALTDYKPLRWYRDAELKNELTDDKKYVIVPSNDSLIVKHTTEEDGGHYYCAFTRSSGVTYSHTVSLSSKPYVEKFSSKSKNLVQGDPLVLDCSANGNPQFTISWLKNEEALPTDDARIKLSPHKGVENASLRIENLDYPDQAEYMCVATNIHGSGNSTVMVRVKDKLAALWPFLGICAEVVILCTIIFIYERRRAKKMEEEDVPEEAGHLTNSNDHKGKDDIRQRK